MENFIFKTLIMILFVKRKRRTLHPCCYKVSKKSFNQKKLGIDFNDHSLRHTHATMLIESGQPIKTVQKRLGHSRSAITEVCYVHLTQKMARDAADIFDSIAEDL
ncbi:tyrosine-type recombinase/integrase [Lysinibacillus fusiformis]